MAQYCFDEVVQILVSSSTLNKTQLVCRSIEERQRCPFSVTRGDKMTLHFGNGAGDISVHKESAAETCSSPS